LWLELTTRKEILLLGTWYVVPAWVKLPPVTQFNHVKVEAISLSTLPNNTTTELTSLSSHYSFSIKRFY